MAEVVHLVVEQGPERGLSVSVPPEGLRVGRSSKNDVVLSDPLLSRHHSRLFFRPNEGLWVTDLGSANETMVNDEPVQEKALRVGDFVTLGDTVLRVVNDGTGASPPAPVAAGPGAVDLGLYPQKRATRPRSVGRGFLVAVLALVVILAVVVWFPRLQHWTRAVRPRPPAVVPDKEHTLEIDYEKVQATSENIFRYRLRVSRERVLSVQIDDLANDRHVRKEKTVARAYVQELAKWIRDSGYFTLAKEYQGIQPDMLDSWDLSVTIDRRTHRSTIVNRLEPDIFKVVRERIEECGKNELGLWAIQFSPQKLVEMAREAHLLGRKLYDEREIQYGNLHEAIQKFTEAEWYLETVEPKPDFYREIMFKLSDCKEDLQRRHDDHNFRAIRAITLREWEGAADELRIILDLIPDPADPRHGEARKKLIDAETRLSLNR